MAVQHPSRSVSLRVIPYKPMEEFKEQGIDKLSGYKLKLAEAAREASKRAFAPFSNFQVGSALYTKGEKIVCGVNYESATYALTMHSEQSALTNARMAGESQFRAIAVYGQSTTAKVNEVVTSCGLCRQLIFEASQLSQFDIEVIMLSSSFDRFIETTISKLLPVAFGPAHFGVDLSKFR